MQLLADSPDDRQFTAMQEPILMSQLPGIQSYEALSTFLFSDPLLYEIRLQEVTEALVVTS